jgi:hypothetical protein
MKFIGSQRVLTIYSGILTATFAVAIFSGLARAGRQGPKYGVESPQLPVGKAWSPIVAVCEVERIALRRSRAKSAFRRNRDSFTAA